MAETVSVHCNGTNDQFYLNIKTFLFLQNNNFKAVAHFYIHSLMRPAPCSSTEGFAEAKC